MPTIEDGVWIDAPVDEVFDYMVSPENHVDFMPSLIEIEDVADIPSGGTEGEFAFKMLGVRLDGHFRDVEFDPPARREYRLEGDIEGTMTYDLRSEDGGTWLDVRNVSEPPGPDFVGRLTDRLVARYLTREIRSTLQNVKMVVEEAPIRAERA